MAPPSPNGRGGANWGFLTVLLAGLAVKIVIRIDRHFVAVYVLPAHFGVFGLSTAKPNTTRATE